MTAYLAKKSFLHLILVVSFVLTSTLLISEQLYYQYWFIDYTQPGHPGGATLYRRNRGDSAAVVGWYQLSLSPEEIADRIGHLSLAQVHTALAYFHANRTQIEADMAAEEIEADRLEKAHYLSDRDSS